MAPTVESVEINRRPEDVFAYLDDLSRHHEWDDQIVETRVETEGPTRVGTRVTDKRKLPFGKQDIPYEITEHDPPRRSAFRGLEGPVRPVGSVTVEPLDDGSRSRVTPQLELLGDNLLGAFAPLANREARKHVASSRPARRSGRAARRSGRAGERDRQRRRSRAGRGDRSVTREARLHRRLRRPRRSDGGCGARRQVGERDDDRDPAGHEPGGGERVDRSCGHDRPRARAQRRGRRVGRRRDRGRRLVRDADGDRLCTNLRPTRRDPRAGVARRGCASRRDAARGGRIRPRVSRE